MSFVKDPNSTAEKSIVEIVPAISFKQAASIDLLLDLPSWATDPRSKALRFQCLAVDDLYKISKSQNFRLPRREVMDEAGYEQSWLFYPPIVDSPKMLTVSSKSNNIMV